MLFTRSRFKNVLEFSSNFELDGITFLEPNIHLFQFNNPYGLVQPVEGYGSVIGIDEDLVIPNTTLSIYENAVFLGVAKVWVVSRPIGKQCL